MATQTKAYRIAYLNDRDRGIRRTVDAAPVSRHVRALLDSGLTARGIAVLANASPSTVIRFRDDRYRTTRRDVAHRLLAVKPAAILGRPDPAGFVPAVGARRRIQALLAIGWRHSDITPRMQGCNTHSQLVLHQEGDLVSLATHRAVCAAYDALSMRPGPSEVTRRRAKALRYAPPLAWDDAAIDDPAATPNLGGKDDAPDDQVVARVLDGQRCQTTSADRSVIIPTLAARGYSDAQIAALCECTSRTVLRTRQALDVESRWSA